MDSKYVAMGFEKNEGGEGGGIIRPGVGHILGLIDGQQVSAAIQDVCVKGS